ncbi:MAG: MATE family efflux transporter, partial [Chloroflexi bacterium]|nr:MATE family efflux transporter [Chloroflexota bacterium]
MSIATLPDDAPSSSAVDLVGNGPPSAGHAGIAREVEVPVVMTGGELRRDVIRLAWPVVVEQLLSTAVSIADVAITGRLGTIALAGSGVALQVFFVVLSGLMSVGIGTTVLVAQATGARTPVRAAGALRQGVVFGGVLSIILTIVGIALAGPAVALGGATGEVADTATSFLLVSMLGLAPLTIQIAVGGAMRGAGDTRTPMIAGAIVNVINIVGAWALAFGAWGAPDLGIVGAAWGGNIARLVGAVLMVAALFRASTPTGIRLGKSAPLGHSGWKPNLDIGRQFLTLSLPAVIEQLSFSLLFLVFGRILLSLGTTVLGAQRIAFGTGSLAWLPAIGLMIATTSLVGQAVGAKDLVRAAAVTRFAQQLAAGWMVIVGVLFGLFGSAIAGAYTTDPATIEEAARGFYAFIPGMPIIGLGFVLGGALRGVGDTR